AGLYLSLINLLIDEAFFLRKNRGFLKTQKKKKSGPCNIKPNLMQNALKSDFLRVNQNCYCQRRSQRVPAVT
ncbi:MAG: hypothetical protein JZU50_04715, partial [Desulfobulbaceae bacterium]|nr:hypothetical protein [Desulfobulbaceae bacterium]